MSKAMLIMDMPESCADCKLSICLKDIGIGRCFATNELLNRFTKVQDWCPLKGVPKKIDYASHFKEDPQSIDFSMGYTKGYNTCIDEILGGGK